MLVNMCRAQGPRAEDNADNVWATMSAARAAVVMKVVDDRTEAFTSESGPDDHS